MSVVIYLGEDTVTIDKEALKIKKQFLLVEDFSQSAGSELTPTLLTEKIYSQGLFASEEKKLLLFKNILLNQVNRGKFSERSEKIFLVLTHAVSTLPTLSILFVEEDANKKKYYEKFFPVKSTLYKEFKLSPNLFYFLDNFYPGNLQKCFAYYQKALYKNAAELIFHMLKRRNRELLLLSTDSLKGNYQSWQLAKLKGQLHFWKQEDLVSFYKALYRIERNFKSGLTPYSTEKSLNILLSLSL